MGLLDDLVAYYKLNESGAGIQATDETGNYNLTVSGASQGATGILGSGYKFAASTSYAASTESLSIGSIFSISFWTQLLGWKQLGYYMNHNATNLPAPFAFSQGWDEQDTTMNLQTGNGGGGNSFLTSSFNLASGGVWYHIVGVRDLNNQTLLYIDGSLDVSGTKTVSSSTAGKLWLGRRGDGWNGSCIVDEIGIWNKALDSDEVSSLYNSGQGLAYPFGESLASPSQQYIIGDELNWSIITK